MIMMRMMMSCRKCFEDALHIWWNGYSVSPESRSGQVFVQKDPKMRAWLLTTDQT